MRFKTDRAFTWLKSISSLLAAAGVKWFGDTELDTETTTLIVNNIISGFLAVYGIIQGIRAELFKKDPTEGK